MAKLIGIEGCKLALEMLKMSDDLLNSEGVQYVLRNAVSNPSNIGADSLDKAEWERVCIAEGGGRVWGAEELLPVNELVLQTILRQACREHGDETLANALWPLMQKRLPKIAQEVPSNDAG